MLIDYEKTRGSGAIVSDCLNLRPDARGDNGILVPAGMPVKVAPAGFMPLVSDDAILLVTKGNDLFAVDTASGTAPRYVCTLPQAAQCAVVTARTVWVMTADGPFRIERTAPGDYTPLGMMPAWPGIALQGVEGDLFEAEIDSVKISSLASELCDAYADLDRQARSAGQLLQPVVARVRIYDDEGTLLHVGPEVLVAGPQGAQLCGNLRFETSGDGDERITAARSMQARGWRLKVRIDDTVDAPWAAVAARADVEVCPQFHPYDRRARLTVANVRGSAKGEITVMMPGAEHGLGDACIAGARRRVVATIERFDDLCRTAASIVMPYQTTRCRDIDVLSRDVDTEADALLAAFAEQPHHVDSVDGRMRVPHSFTADCVARSGATVVWGNAHAVAFGGWDASWFATDNKEVAWQGSVTVDFADGSRRVTTLTGSAAPVALGPVVSYPLPSATRLTLSVHIDGEQHARVFTADLQPDTGGQRALWIADELQTATLEPSADFTVAAPVEVATHDRLVVGTRADSATTARTWLRHNRPLVAIAPVTAAVTGVDTPPTRFYAVGRDAIDVVSVSSGVAAMAATFLTNVTVSHRHCVAATNSGVFVLAGSRLLELKGLSANTLSDGINAEAIVADDAAGEVLAINTDDNECLHLMVRNAMRRYHTSLVCSSVSEHYAVTAEGIVDLCRREVADVTPVAWRATMLTAKGANATVRSMEWPVKGTKIKGTLTIERTWLTPTVRRPAAMATMRIDGLLALPVAMPLHSHPAREVAMVIRADVSPDFAFSMPTITV